jgi:hypothetical protein
MALGKKLHLMVAGRAATVTLRPIVKVSLRTKDLKAAKPSHVDVLAQLDRQFAAIIAGPRGLSEQDLLALAGLYKAEWLHQEGSSPKATLTNWVDNEGTLGPWEEVLERIRGGPDPETWAGPIVESEAVDHVWRVLEIDQFLAAHAIAPQAGQRQALAREIGRAHLEALGVVAERAGGKWQKVNEKRPQWDGGVEAAASGPTFASMIDFWERKADGTVEKGTVRKRVEDFKRFVGHDHPATVTRDDVERWAATLAGNGLAKKTIKAGYLAALGAVFERSVPKIMPTNPCKGVTAEGRKTYGRVGFTDQQCRLILTSALAQQDDASLRWLPWLCAMHGVRRQIIRDSSGSFRREALAHLG